MPETAVAERTLPHNLEAERSVLGAILLHNDAFNLVTLKEELGRSGDIDAVGGPAYIAALVDGVPRSTNVEHYARIIKEKATLRSLIFSANKTLATAYEGG